jgi:hypothetical protein
VRRPHAIGIRSDELLLRDVLAAVHEQRRSGGHDADGRDAGDADGVAVGVGYDPANGAGAVNAASL